MLLVALLAGCAWFASNSRVHADINWDGDNASGNFSFSNNWYGNVIPTVNFAAGNLVFNFRNNPSQLNQFYDFGWANINDIIWETTWPVDTTFNGNGNGLNFNQRLENRSASKVTIGTMNLSGGKNGAAHIELNPVNGDLQLNGNIFNDNNLRYKVYGNNSKMLTVNTALTGNANVGLDIEQYSLVKIAQAQTMGASAAYNIRQGELWISGSGSLANGSTINLGEANTNTAKLYLEGANDGHAITVANSGGTKVIGALDTSGIRTYSGNITLNGAVNLEAVSSGGTVDFSGIVSGGGGATISGLGTVRLSGNNSYTGGTTVNSGTLLFGNNDRLADTGTLTINAGTANLGGFSETVGAVSINGGVVTNGTLSGSSYTAQAGDVSAILTGLGVALTKNGSGILYLSGANTYSGSTTVNAGILEIRNAGALGASSNGTTVASGAALNIYQASGGITVANETLTVNGIGANNLNGALRSTGGTNAWNGAITLGSNTRINADTTGSSGSLTLGGNIAAGANVLFLGAMGGTNGNTGGNITADGAISGAGNTQNGTVTSIYKDGSGILTLGGANDYTGDTRIAQGNLTVSGSGALGNGSDVFIAAGASLTVNSSATVASLREWGTTNGGTATIGSGSTLTIAGDDWSGFMNSIGGTGNMTKSGTGTMNLYGAQSYAGTTTVSGGRLSTGVALSSSGVTVSGGTFETTAANILGDTATVTVNSGTYSLGGDDTVGAISGAGGTLNLGTSRLTSSVASGSSSSFAGVISSTGTGGGLTKSGLGTLVLSGNNTYTGATAVSAGELRINGNQTAANGALTVNSGAILSGSGAIGGATTISGIHNPGNSPGVQTFANNLTYIAGSSITWELVDNTSSAVDRGTLFDGVNLLGNANLHFSGSTALNLVFNSSGSQVKWSDAFWGSNRSWLVYDLNGGVSSGTNNFALTTQNWADSMTTSFNAVRPDAYFSIARTDQDVYLVYTIPEPSTWALLALGAGSSVTYALRKRKKRMMRNPD